MSANEENKTDSDEIPFPANGAMTQHALQLEGTTLHYQAIADWLILRKIHKPVAHIFHTAYLVDNDANGDRPLTFVFNGGPGAASAYLHMGALGPQRVAFGAMGSLPQPPTRVVDNLETWLSFTDLVFIDPVGTGFSRALKESNSDSNTAADAKSSEDDVAENPEFWEIDRDLESLGEFIGRFLSQHHRWTSPIFIAGESYGGFRVAKMARTLQENHGVGLCGALLISPAIEFDSLLGSDYNLTNWVELFPSQALTAHQHGRTRNLADDATMDSVSEQAERFANNELTRWLTQGDAMPVDEQSQIVATMSNLTGLSEELLSQSGGRITPTMFCRELLRDERRLCGRYDGSVTTVDPFPDRTDYVGPDPTLLSIERLFAAGINHHLRGKLAVETELEYRLLSLKVHESWKDKSKKHYVDKLVGAMDDLRYGMSLNEHMRVFIAHGHFDLITPYFSSRRLINLMKLTPDQKERLVNCNFNGGHMFYSWDDSRTRFQSVVQEFYTSAMPAEIS